MRSPLIILMYNSWDMTLDLIGQMIDREDNIWLIDNHSPEDKADAARARFPNLRVIRTDYNGGWAAGYNRALRLAASEGYRDAYLLNGDALTEPGAVDQALALLRETGAAAVGSVVVSMDGRSVEYDGQHHRHGSRPDIDTVDLDARPVNLVHGAAMAISLKAFESVGPFYEPYFLYHEETEWCLRATKQGYSLYADGASRVRHMDGGSNEGANSTYYKVRNRFIGFRRGVPLSGEPESFFSLMKEQFNQFYGLKGDARLAAQHGLIDGIAGVAGPRPPPQRLKIVLAHTALRVLLRLHLIAARVAGK